MNKNAPKLAALALAAIASFATMFAASPAASVDAAASAAPTPPRVRRANVPAPTPSPVTGAIKRRKSIKFDGIDGETSRKRRPNRRRRP